MNVGLMPIGPFSLLCDGLSPVLLASSGESNHMVHPSGSTGQPYLHTAQTTCISTMIHRLLETIQPPPIQWPYLISSFPPSHVIVAQTSWDRGGQSKQHLGMHIL